jgi:hypothetical protein
MGEGGNTVYHLLAESIKAHGISHIAEARLEGLKLHVRDCGMSDETQQAVQIFAAVYHPESLVSYVRNLSFEEVLTVCLLRPTCGQRRD